MALHGSPENKKKGEEAACKDEKQKQKQKKLTWMPS